MCIRVYVCSSYVFYNLSKVKMNCLGIKNNCNVNCTSNHSSDALFHTKLFLKFYHEVLFLNSICIDFMLFEFQHELKTLYIIRI